MSLTIRYHSRIGRRTRTAYNTVSQQANQQQLHRQQGGHHQEGPRTIKGGHPCATGPMPANLIHWFVK